MADSTSGAGKRAAAPAKAAKATQASKAAATAPAPRRATPLAAPVAVAPAAPARQRSIALTATAVVLVLCAVVLLLRLGNQERGGPAHGDFSLGDGLPATLFLPQDSEDDGDLPSPRPKGERPPLIVMAHGYSADRASMSGMARSLARAGYAVLSLDLRGHGSNTHRFEGDLRDDFDTAVDWAETSPYVDGERIAVLGHSMGAGAALDFASIDPRPKAVVPVSGGWAVNDAVTPANTLLLVASGDPDRIHERQDDILEVLVPTGANVAQREIGGTDHLTILRDDKVIAAIVEFLDPVLGIDRPDDAKVGIDDPRYRTAFLYLIVAIGLIALLGSITSRLAPAADGDAGGPPIWSGYVLVGGALVVTLPLMAAVPIDPLPLGATQPIVVHLALASGVLWALRALAQRGQLAAPVDGWLGERTWMPSRSVGLTGLAAGLAIFVLLVPLSGVFHRLVPTPQRLVYWALLSLLCLPFFAAFEALLRRGGAARSVLWATLGRLLLLVVLLLGLALEALPSVIGLALPLLLVQYLVLEVFAAAAYSRARNAAVVAVVDALIIGWMGVMLTPIG